MLRSLPPHPPAARATSPRRGEVEFASGPAHTWTFRLQSAELGDIGRRALRPGHESGVGHAYGFSLERHPCGPPGLVRADALCVAAGGIAALAPGAAVLDGDARASLAVDPGPDADLFG